MRFKEFLLEIQCILESGNTRAKNVWIKRFPNNLVRLYFILGDKGSNDLFACEIKQITSVDVELPKNLQTYKIAYVGFGNVLEDDTINTRQVKRKNATGLKILFAVKNLVTDYVKENKIDIVIFAAKNIDGAYDKRAGAYHLIASASAKQNGFFYKDIKNKEGSFYILSRESISSADHKDIQNMIIPKITFMDKIKK
jgi:hypothetical protein